MRMNVHALRLTAAAPLALLMLGASATPPAKSIRWQTDMRKALAQGAKEKKLLMVDFMAEW